MPSCDPCPHPVPGPLPAAEPDEHTWHHPPTPSESAAFHALTEEALLRLQQLWDRSEEAGPTPAPGWGPYLRPEELGEPDLQEEAPEPLQPLPGALRRHAPPALVPVVVTASVIVPRPPAPRGRRFLTLPLSVAVAALLVLAGGAGLIRTRSPRRPQARMALPLPEPPPHLPAELAEVHALAVAGDPVARRLLATCYQEGLDVPRDLERARRWRSLAEEARHP